MNLVLNTNDRAHTGTLIMDFFIPLGSTSKPNIVRHSVHVMLSIATQPYKKEELLLNYNS